MKVTLDYLPTEKHPYELKIRIIDFDNRKITIYSDMQDGNDTKWCKHRRQSDGRCEIHFDGKPFAADFELIRFLMGTGDARNSLTTKLFGRGWSYGRVDGGVGALCEILPPTKEIINDVSIKLSRLKEWAEYFGVSHCIDDILDWIGDEYSLLNRNIPLYLNQEWKKVPKHVRTFF
jgi:hypothetical protein